VLVLMDASYNPQVIYGATKDILTAALLSTTADQLKQRNTISVAKFKALANCMWSVEDELNK